MLKHIDPNDFFIGLAIVGALSLIAIPVRVTQNKIRVSWRLYTLLCVFCIPAIIVSYGMGRMSMENPERLAHHQSLLDQCLAGSTAPPDTLYCELLANAQTDHVPSFFQEILASATHGILIPHSYPELLPRQELSARVAAERLAALQGPNGSVRFTGDGEEAAKRLLWKDDCALNDPIDQRMPPSAQAQLREGLGCNLTFEELKAQGRF